MKGPELNLNLSDDTQKLLEDLIERKRKWDKLAKQQTLYLTVTAAVCLFFAWAFYRNVMMGSSGNPMAMLGLLLTNKYVLYSLFASIAAVMYARNIIQKTEKAKKKFENLREETIDKLDSSWLKNAKSETREVISIYMKDRWDINLTYKS